ncbi:A-kinase anchor protein 10, mitochondrial-like [Babylonia areolata]|uniref:A-kinase anchor protein 10, mitochondrial-like n=1 Tax=Babylonia areolata TaxID=304850 RepID=UPI003FD3EB78
MPLFKKKQDKQKAVSPSGKDSSLKRSPSACSNPQSPDSANGDIGVPSSMLNPSGLGNPPKLILSEETLNILHKSEEAGGLSPESPIKTSSRLSKTLQEILHDKDALHCFLQFMESRQAERFIRFWLDANSFRVATLTRMRTHSLQSVASSALLKRRTEERGGERACLGQEGDCVKPASEISLRKVDSMAGGHQEMAVGSPGCDRPSSVLVLKTESDCAHEAQLSNSAANPEENRKPLQDTGSVVKDSKPSTLSLCTVSVTVTPAGVSDSSADQQDHSSSSSTDHSLHSLQDSGIATPSEGDFVISPSSQSESLADTESVDTLTDEDSHGADVEGAQSVATDSGSHPKDRNTTADSAMLASADPHQATSVIDRQEGESARQETASKSSRSLSVEEMREKLKKSIERDAVSIFSKYIAKDAPQPIGVDNTLRGETIHKICREDKQVDPECFVACQDFVVSHMEKEYHKPFMDSEFQCKHQVNVLTQTGGQVYLADILYNEHALCYFMEFMEQEGAQHLMQFWMAADNFQQQLIQQEGHYDGMQAQSDAMILYDRFFSLQATTPLGFDDKIRFEVEGNICREGGPLPDCFSRPRDIVLHTLDKVYFSRYMSSEIYYRYLSDLISTVQMAQDLPVKRHRRQASDASSEHSVGSQSVGGEGISTRNTLLAAASRATRKAPSPSSSSSLSSVAGRIEEHLGTMDCDFLNPENLWKQPNKGPLRLGSVNALGQFVSEFDPDPDNSKKKGGSFFKKNRSKEKEQEQMAVQVAQMILSDVANMTQMGDACARIDDPSTTITPTLTRPNTLSSSQSLSTSFNSASFFEPPPS